MEMLTTFVERYGPPGFLLVVSAWLLREIVRLFFSHQLESFKTQARLENDRALEEFKSALRRDAHEREVRRTRFLERRIDVLDGIYRGLVATHRTLELAISPLGVKGEEPKEQVFTKAVELGNQHLLFCEQNRPWVDDAELLALIDSYNDAIVKAANRFRFKDLVGGSDELSTWLSALKKRDEAKEIRKRIEASIREILRAEDEPEAA